MGSLLVRDIKSTSEPKGLRPDCDICHDIIWGDEPRRTHTTCRKTFHRDCLETWLIESVRQRVNMTCPNCRAVLTLAKNFPPVIDEPLSTLDRDMYDYSARPLWDGGEFGSPAFALHYDGRWGCYQYASRRWIRDYLMRLRRAQNLDDDLYSTLVARYQAEAERLMESRLVRERCAILSSVIDVRAGKTVTDFEIISSEGVRRPRPSVVNLYIVNAAGASQWFHRHMNYVQRSLHLDVDEMEQIIRRFQESVNQAISRHHEPTASAPEDRSSSRYSNSHEKCSQEDAATGSDSNGIAADT
jgi:Ring finger domain